MFYPAVLLLMSSGRPLGWLMDLLWASFGLLHRGDLFAQTQIPQGSLAALLTGIRRRCVAALPNLLIAPSNSPTQQGSLFATIHGMFHNHRSRRYRPRLAVPL